MTVEVRHYTAGTLSGIRQHILDVHAEVRHRDFGLTGPFYDVARFDKRLSNYAATGLVAWWAGRTMRRSASASVCL